MADKNVSERAIIELQPPLTLWRRTIERIPSNYLFRLVRQVARECRSLGKDQLMPLVIAILAAWLLQHYTKIPGTEAHSDELLALATFGTGVGAYLIAQIIRAPFVVYREDQDRIAELEADLRARLVGTVPRLEIEFEEQWQFFGWVKGESGKSCYVRVLPRPNTPLTNCKGYLQSVERLDNDNWVPVGFASRPQLHWSEVHEQGIVEVDLLTGNESQFLDVAFVRQSDQSVHLAVDRGGGRLASLFVQYPESIFKFGIAITGRTGGQIVMATIALKFQKTAELGQPLVSKL
jgi:hypothetical protein